ncbi:hypothetical protein QTP88_026935 [Uroleucon formosanum]
MAEIDSQIKQMEKDDIIEPSFTRWNAPLLLVKKKLDASQILKFRIVVDFRALNKVTINEYHPLPNITEILDQLGQCNLFGIIDLASGFYQINVSQEDHKEEELTDAVFNVINSYHIDISYLRGQTYDNAMNMSGQYSGLQGMIKEINPLAYYIPCSAHSLNLIVKELSTRRWSAQEDACRSLNDNWDRVISTLKEIKNNDKQKAQTRCEAKSILKSLACFENNFMSIF